MRIITDAGIQWRFLTALYPLLKQALSRLDKLSEAEQGDLRITNAVTTIRHNIRAIPLRLQQEQLDQILETASFDAFLTALDSLLSELGRRVRDHIYPHDLAPELGVDATAVGADGRVCPRSSCNVPLAPFVPRLTLPPSPDNRCGQNTPSYVF